MSLPVWMAALLAAVAALAGLWMRMRRRPRGVEPWRPRALWRAELACAEELFRSEERGLVARVDRAYRLRGEIVLLELKTRRSDAVYDSDVIELSVQRAALQDATGERVSRRAWVLVEHADSGWRTPHEVALLDDAELAALVERYRRLRAGRVREPEAAASPAQCRQCGQRERCRARYGER